MGVNAIERFGFGGPKPFKASNRALEVADAILMLVEAKAALEKAVAEVPDYTGQWQAADHYANEDHAYNVAAANVARLLGIGHP